MQLVEIRRRQAACNLHAVTKNERQVSTVAHHGGHGRAHCFLDVPLLRKRRERGQRLLAPPVRIGERSPDCFPLWETGARRPLRLWRSRLALQSLQ